jgi:hypothetical protein
MNKINSNRWFELALKHDESKENETRARIISRFAFFLILRDNINFYLRCFMHKCKLHESLVFKSKSFQTFKFFSLYTVEIKVNVKIFFFLF